MRLYPPHDVVADPIFFNLDSRSIIFIFNLCGWTSRSIPSVPLAYSPLFAFAFVHAHQQVRENSHSYGSPFVTYKYQIPLFIGVNDHTEHPVIGDFGISPQFHILELILQARDFVRFLLGFQVGIRIIRRCRVVRQLPRDFFFDESFQIGFLARCQRLDHY